MANKMLRGINFPGLEGTYYVPEIDSTLSNERMAADAKAVGDAINAKLPIVTTTGTSTMLLADVPGITTLTPGNCFIMIPHTNVIGSVQLNVNNLGPVYLARNFSSHNAMVDKSFVWLSGGSPILVCYDGSNWITINFPKPNANDLDDIVKVEHGGTGQEELTSGSYLVGNGTDAVILKTPEEVREDIGATTLIVTINGDTASHDATEIYAHLQNGGDVVALDEGVYYRLIDYTEDEAHFNWVSDDFFVYHLWIRAQRDVHRQDMQILSANYVEDIVEQNAAPKLLIVTVTTVQNGGPISRTASHSASEIFDHVKSGGVACMSWSSSLEHTNSVYFFDRIDASTAGFTVVGDDGFLSFNYINNDKAVISTDVTYASPAYVDQMVATKTRVKIVRLGVDD